MRRRLARALLAAIAEGRAIAGARPTRIGGGAGPARPAWSAAGRGALGRSCRDGGRAWRSLAERGLGADQSNTSVVLGEPVLLKAYRRLEPG